ncbi:hypothetical protein HK102_012621 [Quaeritorhiza haematococci]|nr:hypothetical protein HK102_012621 [Quaeritorhiza haematococci]
MPSRCDTHKSPPKNNNKDRKRMHILIVGAGAVGQVYAHHLLKGGAQIHFLVREHNVENLRNHPLRLHQLHSPKYLGLFGHKPHGQTELIQPTQYQVHTIEDIKKGSLPSDLDAIILTVPSDALERGTWLRDLAQVQNQKGARWLMMNFCPGTEDRKIIASSGFAEEQIVDGIITLIAWQAPLPGQKFDPINANTDEATNPNSIIGYISSPQILKKRVVDAESAAIKTKVVAGFKAGGIPIQEVSHDPTKVSRGIFQPWLLGLEAADWSFDTLKKDRTLLSLTAGSIKEHLEFIGRRFNMRLPAFVSWFIWPWTVKLLCFGVSRFPMMDMEAFLKYHFTKVGTQTKMHVSEDLKFASSLGLSMENTRKLGSDHLRWS